MSWLALKVGELPTYTASYQSLVAATLPMFFTVHDTSIDALKIPEVGAVAVVIVRSGAVTVMGTA